MAASTRSFLFNESGISGVGDVSAGRAYTLIWREISEAISDESSKNDENSKKIIDELQSLRRYLSEEAAKHPNRRVGELSPNVAREFAEARRSIRDIKTGGRFGGGTSERPVSDNTPGVAVSANAPTPGTGVVKAFQENSQAVKDIFGVIGQLGGLITGTFNVTIGTFKAVHNFLNPLHPHGIIHSLRKFFKGGSSIISSLLTGALFRFLPAILSGATILAGTIAVTFAGLVIYMYKKQIEEFFSNIVKNIKDWWNVPPPKTPQDLNRDEDRFRNRTRSFLEPNIVSGGVIEPASFNLETRGIRATFGEVDEGFNIGTSGDSDTVLQLLSRQTELLAKILQALLTGRRGGQGYIRALQAGGNVAPGETAKVGEDGPEVLQVGGRQGVVTEPSVIEAGQSPVSVIPIPRSRQDSGAPGAELISSINQRDVLPHEGFVNPLTNPNVEQSIRDKYATEKVPASIRLNNPGAVSRGDPKHPVEPNIPDKWGGYTGPLRPADEGGRYLQYNTPEEGLMGQGAIIQDYILNRGQNTINKIIWGSSKYPGVGGGYADLGQPEYVKRMSKMLNMDPNEKITFNKEFQYRWTVAQSQHEAGSERPYTLETYARAAGIDPNNLPEIAAKPSKQQSRVAARQRPAPQQAKVPASPDSGARQMSPPVPQPQAPDQPRSTPQSPPAHLPVHGGGPSVQDQQRHINELQRERRQHKEKPKRQRHVEQEAPSQKRQSPNRVAFTGVGPVAVSSGSGFS